MINRSWASAAVGLGACLSAAWLGCSLDEAPFPGAARLTGSGGSAGGVATGASAGEGGLPAGDAGIAPLGSVCLSDAHCGLGAYCNGSSCVAKLALGAACGAAARVCSSGFCVDGFCCDTECNETCKSCAAETSEGIDGTSEGVDGTCANVKAGTNPTDECSFPYVCGRGECRGANGADCGVDADCASGHCAGGVCCDTSCEGVCWTCRGGQKASGADGQCGPVAFGKQQIGQCSGVNVCDGAGHCGLTIGQDCVQDGDCATNHCVDLVCCDTACDGNCEACNQAGALGFCRPLPGGILDDRCPPGQAVCGNVGNVCTSLAENGATCAVASDCASGACVQDNGISERHCKQATGTQCATSEECCSGSCQGSKCKANFPTDNLCDGNPTTN